MSPPRRRCRTSNVTLWRPSAPRHHRHRRSLHHHHHRRRHSVRRPNPNRKLPRLPRHHSRPCRSRHPFRRHPPTSSRHPRRCTFQNHRNLSTPSRSRHLRCSCSTRHPPRRWRRSRPVVSERSHARRRPPRRPRPRPPPKSSRHCSWTLPWPRRRARSLRLRHRRHCPLGPCHRQPRCPWGWSIRPRSRSRLSLPRQRSELPNQPRHHTRDDCRARTLPASRRREWWPRPVPLHPRHHPWRWCRSPRSRHRHRR